MFPNHFTALLDSTKLVRRSDLLHRYGAAVIIRRGAYVLVAEWKAFVHQRGTQTAYQAAPATVC